MTTDTDKPFEVQLAESQEKVKVLENQQFKSEKATNRLKNQLAEAQSSKPTDKAEALKMSQEDLRKALERKLYKLNDVVSRLLIRAKNVAGKLKIQTSITMKDSDDDKTKDVITEKLESLIRESGDSFKQLIVNITPVKGKETRVGINII